MTHPEGQDTAVPALSQHGRQCRNSLSPGPPITPPPFLHLFLRIRGRSPKSSPNATRTPPSAASPRPGGCQVGNAEPRGAPDAPQQRFRSFTDRHPNRLRQKQDPNWATFPARAVSQEVSAGGFPAAEPFLRHGGDGPRP